MRAVDLAARRRVGANACERGKQNDSERVDAASDVNRLPPKFLWGTKRMVRILLERFP
jgi:hypothetical protein